MPIGQFGGLGGGIVNAGGFNSSNPFLNALLGPNDLPGGAVPGPQLPIGPDLFTGGFGPAVSGPGGGIDPNVFLGPQFGGGFTPFPGFGGPGGPGGGGGLFGFDVPGGFSLDELRDFQSVNSSAFNSAQDFGNIGGRFLDLFSQTFGGLPIATANALSGILRGDPTIVQQLLAPVSAQLRAQSPQLIRQITDATPAGGQQFERILDAIDITGPLAEQAGLLQRSLVGTALNAGQSFFPQALSSAIGLGQLLKKPPSGGGGGK